MLSRVRPLALALVSTLLLPGLAAATEAELTLNVGPYSGIYAWADTGLRGEPLPSLEGQRLSLDISIWNERYFEIDAPGTYDITIELEFICYGDFTPNGIGLNGHLEDQNAVQYPVTEGVTYDASVGFDKGFGYRLTFAGFSGLFQLHKTRIDLTLPIAPDVLMTAAAKFTIIEPAAATINVRGPETLYTWSNEVDLGPYASDSALSIPFLPALLDGLPIAGQIVGVGIEFPGIQRITMATPDGQGNAAIELRLHVLGTHDTSVTPQVAYEGWVGDNADDEQYVEGTVFTGSSSPGRITYSYPLVASGWNFPIRRAVMKFLLPVIPDATITGLEFEFVAEDGQQLIVQTSVPTVTSTWGRLKGAFREH